MKKTSDKQEKLKNQIDDATIEEAQEQLSNRIESIRNKAVENNDSGIESVYLCLNCHWEGKSEGNEKKEIICPKCNKKAFLAGINVIVPDVLTIQDPVTDEQLEEIKETVQNPDVQHLLKQGKQVIRENCPKCTGKLIPVENRSISEGNDPPTGNLIFKCNSCGYMKITID